jgi:hypothetical protein
MHTHAPLEPPVFAFLPLLESELAGARGGAGLVETEATAALADLAAVLAGTEQPARLAEVWTLCTVLARVMELAREARVGGAVDVPPWLMSEIVRAAGAGVVLKALDRARAVEQFAGAAAFFDALEAEAAWLHGDLERAAAAAERALLALPHAEALLQARVSAIAGEVARAKPRT